MTADVTDDEEVFWQQRPILAHLRTFARARMASPWAVLAEVLVRVVVATPPHIVLPSIIGGPVSLNLYAGIVGESGAGKDSADAAAADAIDVGELTVYCPGSGEGLAHAYGRRTKDGQEPVTDAVLLVAAEVDTLAALGNRKGATLLPELRRAYTGAPLGFLYADPAKRLTITRHSYRLGLVVSIQPGRAGALFDDADGGTPQRFLWVDAYDPQAPDATPAEPDPLPRWTLPLAADLPDARLTPLEVCDTASDEIRAHRRTVLRKQGDATRGHALLIRLKVAAALALLDHRLDLTPDDWALAGVVMAHSDRVRADTLAHLAAAKRRENATAGRAAAQRQVIVENTLEDRAIRRVCDGVRRKLHDLADADGWVPRVPLSRAIAHRDRDYLDPALDRLTHSNEIEVGKTSRTAAGRGGDGRRYRLRGNR